MATPINITYFLGAGASDPMLPTVKSLPGAINDMVSVLAVFPYADYQLRNQLIESLKKISEEARRYNTIDTYAKKLFLNEEKEKLRELKVTLQLCFLYWQFYNGKGGPRATLSSPKIQSRYISLISTFLEKQGEEIILPTNVRFITWNYDMQLELTLNYFINSPSSIAIGQNTFRSYPNSNDSTKDLQIVHLNGIAGLYYGNNQPGNIFGQFAKPYTDETVIQLMLAFYKDCFLNKIYTIDHLFTFSWEKTTVAQRAIYEANKILEATNSLVIIGYSFPSFNRVVDRMLFENSEKWDKVYYQDPIYGKDILAKTFYIHPNKIQEIKNTDQFFLPFEY